MYTINNTKNCNIFHNSFYQDLEKHTILDDNNRDVYIQYDTVSQQKPVSIRMEAVTGLIDDSVAEEVWTPAFISDENLITHKPFFGKQQIKNTILGVEDVITFESRLKNWETEEASSSEFKSINMSSNWFISSMLTTIKPEYGVLFWYKKNSSYSTSGTLPYKDIPVGTIVSWTGSYSYKDMTLGSGNYGVKVNNSTISLLNKKSALIQNSTDINASELNVSFNSEIQTVDLGVVADTDNFYVLTKGIPYASDPAGDASFYDLWISDGECFSYYETEVASLRGRANQENSNTYLSPGLFSIYREIYHRLTLRRVKGTATALNRKKSLALQKLCYFLSSSPLIDRTTIDLLNDQSIYDAVNTYLDLNITSMDNEKTELKNILNTIFTRYKSLSKSTFQRHTRNNYIQTKLDLVKKLISKYPPVLSLTSDTGLKFKKPLDNGPHAFLSLSSFNMYDKTTPVASSIYNNSSIKIGNIKYSTDISTTGSLINIKADNFSTTGNIPLADISLPTTFSDNFYLGTGVRKSFTTPETEIDGSLINPSPGNGYSYYWERVSGPLCLRFGDYNKDRFRQQRFITSTDESPTVYLYQAGTYEIKATRSKSGGIIQSDILKITTSDTEPLNASITLPATYTKNKVISGVFKQLAFNKRGLLWIIDSDNYYDNGVLTGGSDDNYDSGIFKLKDIQLDFNINQQTITTLHSNADLKLSFFPNNTKILLLSMQIENMRDRNNKYGQCKSFFKEKILRETAKPPLADGAELGSSDFYRKYQSSTTFTYHNDTGSTNDRITYGTPKVSTTLSPTILPYGGYSSEVVDALGIKMSGHSEPAAAEMPVLLSRNDLTSQTGTYCHLKEIIPTGTGHYVEFKRGHFHPLSGWINNTSSNFATYTGKSSVISHNLEKQKSFVFSGPGFVNLRPSLDGQKIVYQSKISLNSTPLTVIDLNNRYGFDNINYDANSNPNIVVDEINDNNRGCSLPTQNYGIPTVSTSNLTIKDIEVKLNFLNYANPKNMVVWLEIKNSAYNGGDLPSNDKFFISNDPANYSSNTELSSYISVLDSMNPIPGSPTTGISKLYLLNQEQISNYSSNFSIKFSDHANKYINTTTTVDESHIRSSLQKDLYDNGEILPSVIASGYNDIDAEKYRNIIRTNQINKISSSFSKFIGTTLTDTEFTLNFAFIDALDHPNTVLDNLLTNDGLAGLSLTENKYYSTSVSNSLCSWEIILHTDNIRQSTASDILGYIDYTGTTIGSEYIPHSGVNYIGDFSGRNFLIPNVNINAPYPYLGNINKCFYSDPDMPRGISSQHPTFPSLLPYAMMGATLGFAGVVGGLGALAIASAFMANGGRNDPIINYFINTRFFNQTQALNAQYYKPVYSDEFFGKANTAIICASNDGARWYYFEVPIFRYINTPAIQKNRYKFIKLAQNNIPALSHFNYQTIKNYSDFKLSPIAQSTISNISNLSGTGTISSDMPPFYKNDIVYVGNQTTTTENGYYVVKENSWEKIPDSLNSIFLQNNKSKTSTSIDSATKQNILVNGTRAFNCFDISDTVYVSSADTTATVTAKYLLSTSEGNKTLFVLSSGIEENGYITKTSGLSDLLFLYKDDVTTKTSEGFPINNWSFDNRSKDSIAPINPESHFSTYGEGSIGWGTDVRDPETLYTISPDYNKLLHTKDIINNNINDRLKLNQITIINDQNNISFINFTDTDINYGLLRGWSYSNNDFGYIFENNDSIFSDNLTENSLIKKLRSTSFADRSAPVLMDIKCSKFVGAGVPASGSIILQNDFIKSNSVKFNSSAITTITDRLNLLVTSIIPSGIEYYNGLQNDPPSCLKSATYSSAACPKTEAKQALANFSREKNELQTALSLSSLADITPYISGIIVQTTGDNLSPADSGIKVSYKENRDLYWIHIDPEKYCHLANEISAKILYKTEYNILPVVGDISNEDSQITPNLIGKSISNGVDESLVRKGNILEYETSQSGIISEMNRLSSLYPSISWSSTPPNLWDKSEEYYYGSLSADGGDSKKLLVCIGDSSKDMLICMRETYIRPIGTVSKTKGKIKDMLDLTSNTLKIKFRNLPRKIKSIDSESFKVYSYDKNGNLVKSTKPPSSVGVIANNFVCWHCINPSGEFVNPSGFLVAQNEMIYRNFFGSVDGIENKNSQYMDTQEAWEWIPYEYYIDTTVLPVERACACGSVQTGGAGTTTDIYAVPTEEGMMVLSYNSYDIQDRYVIDYDGQVEFDSGFVSGSGIHSFTKPDGVDEISVTVNGGELNTNWAYTLSCPEAPP
jgi:hypothetical protein